MKNKNAVNFIVCALLLVLTLPAFVNHSGKAKPEKKESSWWLSVPAYPRPR